MALNISGIFIKMGQHISSLVVLPKEWTTTMRPLQDQCQPTEYGDIEALFLNDMGTPISEIFDDFDPNPIGVASLAQVHVGRHKASGREVAVKVWQLSLRVGIGMILIFVAAATSTPRRVL